MIVFQEAAVHQLPQLSQSSLFIKFNEQSQLFQKVKDTLMNKESYVNPEEMKEIMALIRLNGSPIAKKAVQKYEDGDLKILFNKTNSQIPNVLPYIIIQDKTGKITPYVFADRVMSNINSSAEYQNLMATMEAAYLAAALRKDPAQFLLNRNLVLTLCELYNYLWIVPLEQKLYVKGENLTKIQAYVISYFYRMVDDNKIDAKTIPFNRILKDKVPEGTLTQIVTEVKTMPSLAFGNLIQLIQKINPVRYKNLETTFMTYFASACGIPLIFALENLQYLFLLMSSANYKTKLTAWSLNKVASKSAKACLTTLNGMDIRY